MAWHEYGDRKDLIEAVSQKLADQLASGLQARTEVAVALSGGSTPMPIYHRLSQHAIDWERVHAIPTDERWIDRSDSANNAHQIQKSMSGCAIEVHHLVPTGDLSTVCADYADEVIGSLPKPFEAVVVGMGSDAHFASLFPHSDALTEGLCPDGPDNILTALPDPLPPQAPYARLTLSLSQLLATQCLMLVITGEEKKHVLEKVMSDRPSQIEAPIAALVEAAGDHLEIYWSP